MGFAGVAFVARGASRLSPYVGPAGKGFSSSSRALGLSGCCSINPKAVIPKVSGPLSLSFSPSLRATALRALGGASPCQPPVLFSAPAAAAAAACRSMATNNTSNSNGGSSNNSTTVGGGGDGLGEATGIEGEGVETRPFSEGTAEPPDGNEIQKLKAELSASREALAAANAKVRELQDKLLRALAEQENARVRLTKEVASARDYAMSGFAKALLEVGDSLCFAREQLQQSALKQQEEALKKDFQQFIEGVSLTENLFHKTLERFGVQQYDPIGEQFNPALHEALFEMEGPAEKVGSIAQVVQRGYKIKDRVLRAAKVGVVKGK